MGRKVLPPQIDKSVLEINFLNNHKGNCVTGQEKPLQLYWAIRDLWDETITPIQHHLLLFLQTCMGKDGECYYGVDEIARKTRWKKRTIQENLSILIKKKYVILKRKGGRGPKDTNIYSLNINLIKGAPGASFQGKTYQQECAATYLRVRHTANKDAPPAPEVIDEDIYEDLSPNKTSARKKKSFLSEKYNPSDEHFIYARNKGIDILNSLQMFKDRYISKGEKSYDWDMSFMAWLRGSYKKEASFSKEDKTRPTRSTYTPLNVGSPGTELEFAL